MYDELEIYEVVRSESIKSSSDYSLIMSEDGDNGITSIFKSQRILSRRSPEKSSIFEVFKYITVDLPDAVFKIRNSSNFKNSGEDVEICDISDKIISDIAEYADEDISELYKKMFNISSRFFSDITIKELFLIIIMDLKISFKRAVSKQKLESIIYSSPGDCEILHEPTEIRLSRLLKHYFLGDSYTITDNNCNNIAMNNSNKDYYYFVGVMAKFLFRKQVLIIDYSDFLLETESGEIVKALNIDNFHYSENGIYYHNKWIGSEFFNDRNNKRRNSLMAILSYVKFKMFGK